MMVNGVALSSMIAGGWGGGAVPNATGTAEFAIDVSGVDAQAATGGVRINFIPRDGGNRFSGTIVRQLRNRRLGQRQLHRHRRASARAPRSRAPSRRTATSTPALAVRSSATSSGSSCRGDRSLPTTTSRAPSSTRTRTSWTATTTCRRRTRRSSIRSRRSTRPGSLGRRRRNTSSAVTYDQENFCACTTGIGPGTGGAVTTPEAGNDRRFPLQRFVTMDWSTPVSNKLLHRSQRHSPRRTLGRHGAAGGQAGQHRPPGARHDLGHRHASTRLRARGAHLSRGAPTYNNSWNWNLHYRAAVSYITGSHTLQSGLQQRLRAPREHDLQLAGDAVQLRLHLDGADRRSPTALVPRTVEVNVDRDLGLFAQDKWTTGRLTLSGALRWDSFANSFPAQAHRRARSSGGT